MCSALNGGGRNEKEKLEGFQRRRRLDGDKRVEIEKALSVCRQAPPDRTSARNQILDNGYAPPWMCRSRGVCADRWPTAMTKFAFGCRTFDEAGNWRGGRGWSQLDVARVPPVRHPPQATHADCRDRSETIRSFESPENSYLCLPTPRRDAPGQQRAARPRLTRRNEQQC